MKVSDGRLSAFIGKDAKKELANFQTDLRYNGCGDNETSPGKIVASLILMPGAIEYLRQNFIKQ